MGDTPARSGPVTNILRARAFRIALLRQALPVAGVILLGWPVVQATMLFLADLWLALTLRTALELTFDHRGRLEVWHPASARPGRALPGNLAFFGVLYGIVVAFGAFGQVAVGFPGHEWGAFLASGWREPAFVGSLVALFASHAWESARYRRHVLERTDDEARADDIATHAGWARLVLVCLGTLVLPLVSALGYGAQALVVALALVNVAVDGLPVEVTRRLGFEP